MLQLKGYQEKALESLRLYLQECNQLQDADEAFYRTTRHLWEQGIPYRAIKEPSDLADIPYICLRLPTGGGKTLLACHAVALANREYLKRSHSLVLWLVPSNTIKEQTLNALKDRDHAYRQALDGTLPAVTVLSLSEALSLQPAAVIGSTVIIVATLQAFRVEDKEGRKVYETDGALMPHFQNLSQEIVNILDRENGIIPHSLANVMRIYRPLVIVDEAHNARTELSFYTLARFRPSAIIEFTATPDSKKNPSNVLHSTSAAELKAENMIKLPIRLETHTDWRTILSDAIAQRIDLEKKAEIEQRRTGDYLRPIMLIQAQPRRRGQETLSVEAIEKSLIEDHRIPANQIARATGEDKGLEGIDLADEECPIRYVITVQALREGWDCPFAYVLCSVTEQKSIGAVEQILGRVLRLPYCKPKSIKELDRAYAFVTSSNFAEAAGNLVDALVENGFNRQEAEEFVRRNDPGESSPLFDFMSEKGCSPEVTFPLDEIPDTRALSPEILAKIEIDAESKTVKLKDSLYPVEKEEFVNLLPSRERERWIYEIDHHQRQIAGILKKPSERELPFQVPALSIKRGEQLEIFEEDHLIEKGWDLSAFDPRLSSQEYNQLTGNGGQFGEIDIGAEGKIKSRFIPELDRQLKLIEVVENWTGAQLIHWLDKEIFFLELSSGEREIFLTSMIGDLLDGRGMGLSQIIRKKFELRKIVENKLRNYRREARKKVYQELLFGDSSIVVSPAVCFSFNPDQYPYRFICPASDSFRNHYYPKIGDLDDKGEEFQCAQFIDQMKEVEFWVRNLDRQERFSFWLQTSTDKFYPDFVCKLRDGRHLVVEYKGEHLWSNDDSKEKRRLGELWALKSARQCIFVMPKGKDWEAIKSAIL
jgi:type III restriction enzyme